MLKDPELVMDAIRLGMVETVQDLLPNEDVVVRETACNCLLTFAAFRDGRLEFERLQTVLDLAELLDDPCMEVRLQMHQVLAMFSNGIEGADTIAFNSDGLVTKMLDRLPNEHRKIKPVMLHTLRKTFEVDRQEALYVQGLITIQELLSDKHSWKTQAGAIECIAELCADPNGKVQALVINLADDLVCLMSSSNCEVSGHACIALAFVADSTPGKFKAWELGATEKALELLQNYDRECICENLQVPLNALKLLSNLAFVPDCRKFLLEEQNLELVQSFLDHEEEAVATAAKKCADNITWKP